MATNLQDFRQQLKQALLNKQANEKNLRIVLLGDRKATISTLLSDVKPIFIESLDNRDKELKKQIYQALLSVYSNGPLYGDVSLKPYTQRLPDDTNIEPLLIALNNAATLFDYINGLNKTVITESFYQAIQIHLLFIDPNFIQNSESPSETLITLILAITLLLKLRSDNQKYTPQDYAQQQELQSQMNKSAIQQPVVQQNPKLQQQQQGQIPFVQSIPASLQIESYDDLKNCLVSCYGKAAPPLLQNSQTWMAFKVLFPVYMYLDWDKLSEDTKQKANLLLTPLTSKLNENALQIHNSAVVTVPSAIITYINKITTQTRPDEQSFGLFFKQLTNQLSEAISVRNEMNHNIKKAIGSIIEQSATNDSKAKLQQYFTPTIVQICESEIDEYTYKIIDIENIKLILEKSIQSDIMKKYFGTTVAFDGATLGENYKAQVCLYKCLITHFTPLLTFQKSKQAPLNLSMNPFIQQQCQIAKTDKIYKNQQQRYQNDPVKLSAAKTVYDIRQTENELKRKLNNLRQDGKIAQSKLRSQAEPQLVKRVKYNQVNRDQLKSAIERDINTNAGRIDEENKSNM